jgi:hypothetical protein
MGRNINSLNFKEIISMIFHGTKNIHEKKVDTPDTTKWSGFYEEFQLNLESQNKTGWFKPSYMTNTVRRRMEVFSPSSFVQTKNLLVMVLRLLYIESFKQEKLKEIPNNNFYEILSYKIDIEDKYPARQVSLTRLFEIFKLYMNYYVRIYQNGLMYEYILGKTIIDQI